MRTRQSEGSKDKERRAKARRGVEPADTRRKTRKTRRAALPLRSNYSSHPSPARPSTSPASAISPPPRSPPSPLSLLPTPTRRSNAISGTMHHLLSRLSTSTATICPSQIPRTLHSTDGAAYPDWRDMMDEVREVVWDHVRAGTVEVTQRGVVRTVQERAALKGPIRVRRGPRWDRWRLGDGSRGGVEKGLGNGTSRSSPAEG